MPAGLAPPAAGGMQGVCGIRKVLACQDWGSDDTSGPITPRLMTWRVGSGHRS